MSPEQLSLLPAYPEVPGARRTETSMIAADAIAEHAPSLKERILDKLDDFGKEGAAPDEMAAEINADKYCVRPRFSELKKANVITESGFWYENESSKPAEKYIKAKKEES
ncbi:MAG: hypothetical protein WD407_08795 [Rhodospirillales bacterium]